MENVIALSMFSPLDKTLRVIAWVKKLISNLKRAREKRIIRSGELDIVELQEGERNWKLDAQADVS